jgi:cytochrome P450
MSGAAGAGVFGKGSPHFCLGNHLARLEIRLMFETLLTRITHIELAGDVAGYTATS